jgi:hypothetical protein
LVATGAASITKAGRVDLSVKLTAAGKVPLRHTGHRVALTSTSEFTAADATGVVVHRRFTVRRRCWHACHGCDRALRARTDAPQSPLLKSLDLVRDTVSLRRARTGTSISTSAWPPCCSTTNSTRRSAGVYPERRAGHNERGHDSAGGSGS